jgi:uncharacterized membrane protein YcaP (DUF421 family)
MFDLSVSGWEIAARTALVYGALLVGLRMAGKRELGQMTPFDLVVILLIANAVQNAMVGSDVSVTGGLIAAAVLLVVNIAVSQTRERLPWLQRAVAGTPTLLIENGAFIAQHLAKERLEEADVLMALREHGFANADDVQSAVLETDGSISVIPKTTQVVRTRRHPRLMKKG